DEPANDEPAEEPAIAARESPEEPALEPEAPPAANPQRPDDLPPHYFRAAGDPDEGEAEAPPSQWGRLKARIDQTTRDIWAAIEPRWVAFWGVTNTLFGEIWRRAGGVKRPRNLRETAVWTGYAAAGFFALIIGFFFFVTWGMPSTDDLWEARQGQ